MGSLPLWRWRSKCRVNCGCVYQVECGDYVMGIAIGYVTISWGGALRLLCLFARKELKMHKAAPINQVEEALEEEISKGKIYKIHLNSNEDDFIIVCKVGAREGHCVATGKESRTPFVLQRSPNEAPHHKYDQSETKKSLCPAEKDKNCVRRALERKILIITFCGCLCSVDG